MKNKIKNLNDKVTEFLDGLNHPFRKEIEQLRIYILTANKYLTENIKWNGPNYCYEDQDRITIRIHANKELQIIFHRGAKEKKQLNARILEEEFALLLWKENDRAIATFKTMVDIEKGKKELMKIVTKWIQATK